MKRITKRFTSLGYATRKAYRKISTAKPSIFIISAVIAALSIFLLGGGVYDILEKPLVAIPIGSRVLFYYPGTVHEQTILDSSFAMVSYFFGLLGLLLMYQSTRYAYSPRQAWILLLVGAFFIFVAYVFMENLIWAKLSA